MVENCKLCQILLERSAEGPIKIENTCIYETENFIVIPALGPLVVGHVLVVSKFHYDNLLAMDVKHIFEYQNIIEHLKLKSNGFDLLQAEHGSNENNLSGSCIVHTHVNVLPIQQNLFDRFDKILNTRYENINFENNQGERNYIILADSLNNRIYDSFNLPSQFLRRIISEIVGEEKWDWKKNPKHKLIKKTIEYWRERVV